MSDLRAAAQQALTEIANARDYIWLLEEGGTGVSEKEILDKITNVITDLRAALAEEALQRLTNVQQEMERADSKHATIAEWWVDKQRKPLTDGQIHDCFQQKHKDKVTERRMIARAIEAAHGIKDA